MRSNDTHDCPSVHRSAVRVRVADTDLMGVVYHSNYLVWFEIGRTELIRARGLSYAEVGRHGYSLPVIEARFRVFRPAHYDDLLDLDTWVEGLRSREVRFRYRLSLAGQTLVEGQTAHVPVRTDTGRAATFPAWLSGLLLGGIRGKQPPGG